jgi:hypothetical protein
MVISSPVTGSVRAVDTVMPERPSGSRSLVKSACELHMIRASPSGRSAAGSPAANRKKWGIEDHEIELLAIDRSEQVAFNDPDPVLHTVEQHVYSRAPDRMWVDIRCGDDKATRGREYRLDSAARAEVEGPGVLTCSRQVCCCCNVLRED